MYLYVMLDARRLLGYAVTLEYSDPDNIKEYTAAKPRGSAAAAAAPAGGRGAAAAAAAAGGGGAVVLDTASIRELAKILQLQEHPDDLVLLRAVTNAVRKKLKPSQVTIAAAMKVHDTSMTHPLRFLVNSRTLMGCADLLSGRRTPSVFFWFSSKLPLPLYADVRVHIPMTHVLMQVRTDTQFSSFLPSFIFDF